MPRGQRLEAPRALHFGTISSGASDLPRRACQDVPSPGSPVTAAPSCPATHAQIQRGMTNVIDLDEPYLKREGMIQGQNGVDKGLKRSLQATCYTRYNHFYHNALPGLSNVVHSPTSSILEKLNFGRRFPNSDAPRGKRHLGNELWKGPPRCRGGAPKSVVWATARRRADGTRTPPRIARRRWSPRHRRTVQYRARARAK
jgi:hypothetical protein